MAACATEQDPGTPLQIQQGHGASAPAAGSAGLGGAAGSGSAGAQASQGAGEGPGGEGGQSAGSAGSAGAGGKPGQGGGGGSDAGAAGSSAGQAGSGGSAQAAGSGGAQASGGAGDGGSAQAGQGGAGGEGQGGAASGAGGDAGEGGGSGACPPDMVSIDDFCMDRYEAPNQLGALPLAMQTAPDGEAWCNERGKRLCSEAEWLRACEGTAKTKYPYGSTYEEHRCNDDKTWISPSWSTLATWPSDAAKAEADKLYQADPSGDRQGCVSVEGAYDLTGNVAEWVTRSFATSGSHDHVLKGCYWSKCYGGSNPSCTFVNGAHPGTFRTYEAGFRCCQGPP